MKQHHHSSKPQLERVHFTFDVEADGPCPGLYSMLSIGIVDIKNPSQTFYAEFKPVGQSFDPNALRAIGLSREETLRYPEPAQGMIAMKAWLDQHYANTRKIMWSDNPGFDWQFLNYYAHLHLKTNPFGHSCRRIGDLSAGLSGRWQSDTDWKSRRTTAHTHNALDDALGNAGAIRSLWADCRPKSKSGSEFRA